MNGSDTAAGTSRYAAFATVQKCVATAPSGSTCFLGSGRYDRTVDQAPMVLSGEITIAGDPMNGDGPGRMAVLDGSVAITTTWSAGSGAEKCIYTSAPLTTSTMPWQLWVDGLAAPPTPSPAFKLDGYAPLTPARFPNARLDDDTVFKAAPAGTTPLPPLHDFSNSAATPATNGSLLYSSKDSTPGHIVDDGTHVPSLASSGIDFTGIFFLFSFSFYYNIL